MLLLGDENYKNSVSCLKKKYLSSQIIVSRSVVSVVRQTSCLLTYIYILKYLPIEQLLNNEGKNNEILLQATNDEHNQHLQFLNSIGTTRSKSDCNNRNIRETILFQRDDLVEITEY